MPGTRSGGAMNSDERNSLSGIACFSRFWNTSWRPRFQVSMMMNRTAPSNSGNQPPWNSFRELAANRFTSMNRKKPVAAQHSSKFIFQR